ncbi:Hypothetical predicted protein [Pelobates cultripes]|uniref:Uncharacterized protein n=1 Tax=Pelobates cultripes TaxID=61616 RepID=A0AAD1R6T5_PELCU|nr:Hypothetical predicted protein [Pelobates cultripes]
MSVWILLLVVLIVLKVSALYSSTDFTLKLNSQMVTWCSSKLSGSPDVLELDDGNSCFADPCLDICICSTLLADDPAQVGEELYFFQGTSIQGDCVNVAEVGLKDLGLLLEDDESNLCCCSCQHTDFLLHLLLDVGEKCEVIGKVQVIQLTPQGPLDSIFVFAGGCLHDPVNGNEEEERG